MKEDFYTVAELATMFGKTKQTIHNWIDQGRFPHYRTFGEGGGKLVLVPASDVEAVRKEERAKLQAQLDRLNFHAVTA